MAKVLTEWCQTLVHVDREGMGEILLVNEIGQRFESDAAYQHQK